MAIKVATFTAVRRTRFRASDDPDIDEIGLPFETMRLAYSPVDSRSLIQRKAAPATLTYGCLSLEDLP